MKDTKSLTLLLLSSVLFLLSIILLCTWGYQYYHQIQDDKTKTQKTDRAAPAVADDTRDSLLKIYKLTLNSIGNSADSAYTQADSLNGQLNVNLQEFYRLRDEIAGLLQSQTPKAEDLITARKKITELQLRVSELKFHNTDVEKENQRLKAVIEQLSRSNNNNRGDETSVVTVQEQNYLPGAAAKKINASPGSIVTANINLSAVSNENDAVTADAKSAEKLVGSFIIRNNSGNSGWCDLMVVVTNPGGQVIQKSAWESGTFETPNGKRIYSVKIRCEAEKGTSRQLSFSLNADSYPKGNYTMLIYHNGKVIGRATKAHS